MSYNDLVIEKNNIGEHITYLDKLSTIQWKNKRNIIINRDNNCCKICKEKETLNIDGEGFRDMAKEEKENFLDQYYSDKKNKESIEFGFKPAIPMVKVDKVMYLHVHHTYYINNKLPWEYSNDSLITLCQECHQKIHENSDIPVYLDDRMLTEMELTKCSRCKGSGFLEQFHYYLNGVCFRCDGNKYDEFIE